MVSVKYYYTVYKIIFWVSNGKWIHLETWT